MYKLSVATITSVFAVAFFLLSLMLTSSSQGQSVDVQHGELIRATGTNDIYYVQVGYNGVKYKRLLPNSAVISLYADTYDYPWPSQLSANNVREVSQQTMNEIITSNIIRASMDQGRTWRSYKLFPNGVIKELRMGVNDFTVSGYDWNSQFYVFGKEVGGNYLSLIHI